MTAARINGYGLVIGVGTYDDPALNVPIAERDALGIFEAFTAPGSGYDPARFTLLTGREATRDRIGAEMIAISRRADPESIVVICYTGHGLVDSRGMYCLAASDTTLDPGQKMIGNGRGYRIADIARDIQDLRASRVLIVINSCGAGNISRIAGSGMMRDSATGESSQAESVVRAGQGRALILASRPGELSYFTDSATYSVMGQALIDGLRGVTTQSRGGYIGLFEWYEATYAQVSAGGGALGQPQHPRLVLMDGEGAFPVIRHPRPGDEDDRAAISQSPPPISDLVHISFRAGSIGTAIGRDSVVNQTADIPPMLSRMVDDQREAMLRLVDVVLRQGDDLRTQFAHIQAEVRDSISRIRDEVTIYRRMDEQSNAARHEKDDALREQRQQEVDHRDRRIIFSLLALMVMVFLLLVVLLVFR